MSSGWAAMMMAREQEGRADAKKGVYDLPYVVSDCNPDPQDENENGAYNRGWWAERRLLGTDFEWRQ